MDSCILSRRINTCKKILKCRKTVSAVFCYQRKRFTGQLRWEGMSGDHLIHCPAYSRFCQSRLLRLWSSWFLGISKNGNPTVSLGDLLKRNSCTLLLSFHLAIERKKAIERNFIALICCYVRYSTFYVPVNNVKGVMVFLSL